MRIFHPQTTLHGAERDNSFIVQDNAGVELGRGWLMAPAGRAPATREHPHQIRMHLDAHPAARDMLYGALYARGKFLGRQRGDLACLVAACDPNDADMRNYYAAAGFDDTDGEELFFWDLTTAHRQFYAPVGTTIVPTFLQTRADMDALLMRINHWSGDQHHEVEWLMEAMELPYFVVCGVYSGNDCIGEAMATGADGEAVLEMLYTLPTWRRHHAATALLLHIKAHLAQHGAKALRVHAQRSNMPAMGLLQKLKFRWVNTIALYPTLYI
jgi:ribosomal protein S18 acetylase RimI-like enzyme